MKKPHGNVERGTCKSQWDLTLTHKDTTLSLSQRHFTLKQTPTSPVLQSEQGRKLVRHVWGHIVSLDSLASLDGLVSLDSLDSLDNLDNLELSGH